MEGHRPVDLKSSIHSMTNAIRYRGPDGNGIWVDKDHGVALGHRRLAIIDVSEAGHQPMHSSCGRYVISYNGEVYNFRDLRTELLAAGRLFKGHSDTEVILEAIAEWGLVVALNRFIGMFAIALWDRDQRQLSLVRDRLGIKPVYYSGTDSIFLFASELKALMGFPGMNKSLDQDAVASFMRHGYIPAPHTVFKSVAKLEPGQILYLEPNLNFRLERYWSLDSAVHQCQPGDQHASDADSIEALDTLLSDAVGRRMIADVPLGAFLSGGIDSSTVVALMQKHSPSPVRTFTIGFNEHEYDEARHAKKIAQHLGTDHTELYVESRAALDLVPELPRHYDEPFADSSQIPTLLVSRLTRNHVTVALSGDGGDEVFAGYNRYFYGRMLTRRLSRVPRPLRAMMATLLTRVPVAAWQRLFNLVPAHLRPPQAGDKVHKLAGLLSESDADIYRRLISLWEQPAEVVSGAREYRGLLWDESVERKLPDLVARMQYLDTLTYLPDDILTKVDRASMSVSLEARVPLLDHRVVEHAWSLPMSMKLRGGQGKWLLRQVLYRYVPRLLVDRPKMGFGVPIDHWLRSELRDWAEELLSPRLLERDGLLNRDLIHRRWAEHLSGVRNWQYPIWNVLMFQAWRQAWLPTV